MMVLDMALDHQSPARSMANASAAEIVVGVGVEELVRQAIVAADIGCENRECHVDLGYAHTLVTWVTLALNDLMHQLGCANERVR